MQRRQFGALVVAASATACRRENEPKMGRLAIAAGGDGGLSNRLGQALARAARDRLHLDASLPAAADSVQNLEMLADRTADLALTTVDIAALALDGERPATRPIPLRALTGLYDDYLQVVAPRPGPALAITDLRNRRVSTGAKRSSTNIVAARVLQEAGIDPDRDITRYHLPVADSAGALLAGRLDAFFFAGGLRTPAIAALANLLRIQVLSLGPLIDTLPDHYNEVYYPRTFPAATYRGCGAASTIGIPNLLVVHRDMPSWAARQLTAFIFEAKPSLVAVHTETRRLDQRSALATYPVPLHAGAARYYRDAKIMPGR
jgi:uncharacterized protein